MTAACIAIAIFCCLSLYCAIRSDGFIAADACIHYLYSRFAFSEPTRFVDVWARPLVTALYALPAALGGRLAVRILAMLVAVGCALVAMSIARQQNDSTTLLPSPGTPGEGKGGGSSTGPPANPLPSPPPVYRGRENGLDNPAQNHLLPVLALIFTLGQPMLFLHSFGEMTELPFALVLGLAFLAYQRQRIVLAAALVALTPLARPEGFGFIVLMAGAVVASRRWCALLLLPLPLVAWDIVGWLISPHVGPWWRWLIDAWPYAGQSLYGSGNALALLGQLPAIVSPMVLPATIIGTALYLRSKDKQLHARLCGILIAWIPLFIFTVHTFLYWTGRLASFGEVRYLLVAAPFWGVLSARGWEWFFARFALPRPLLWSAIAVLAPPIAANAMRPVVPIPLSPEWVVARDIAAWCNSPEIRHGHPRLMAAHPGIFYFLDISPCDRRRIEPWTPASLQSAPAGTLLLWDPIYPSQNASADHAITHDQIVAAGWQELRQEKLPPGEQTKVPWHVYVRPQ